jgi:hypothetical protein
MAKVWRGMKCAGERPQIAPGQASGLGVRTGDCEYPDIGVDPQDNVMPATGGMSVSSSVDQLPGHRVPRRLKEKYPDRFPFATASNAYGCWCLGDGEFVASLIAPRLCFRPDPEDDLSHGFIEPETVMLLVEYERALGDTQGAWLRWEG